MTITLTAQRRISWVRPDGCPAGFEPDFVVVGNGDAGGMGLEIAVSKWAKPEVPTREALGRLHNIRLNKRAQPLVLVVDTPRGTIVFGPNSSAAPVGPLPTEQAQRVLQAALDEPTVIAARARLAGLVQSLDSTSMAGVKNSGLFANHELRVGVPQRSDWNDACERSAALLPLKSQQLVEKLGFKSGRAGAHALLLTGVGPRPEAIAVMLDEREAFDADSPRFAVSPVAYGLRMAEQSDVPWLIMMRGTQLRLYPARIEYGVGRKGLAETFFELDLPQLTPSTSGYLDLIFSAKALGKDGTAYEILRSSTQYAVELGERLRDKVYEEIIPELAVAVAEALVELDYEMDAEGLDLAYQLTLRVFFRMLFQVYAEDRKLLPYGENAKYDRNAIKTLAKDLAENPEQEFDEESTSLWDDLAQVWRVIDSGDKAWGVPAYNGGLFSSDKELNEHGYILKDIRISNAVMGPVLKALLLDEDDDGKLGQIDFRSLSVREFGTIYEGLLESSLGLAELDLTLDEKGTWLPAKKKDEVWAYAGQVYFHNTSGQRKGTGSYFTPSFVVEHLLERSLDPALDAHLEKVAALLQKGDQAGAGELFFDFRVADLAMGSGHFLTAAIDHIEQRMAAFLADENHAIPGVTAELQKLERAAIDALGPDAPEPERSSLLRRQIARRCIYGLDINPIAVELARVSIWIHTFVRGLPMSSLDHNLVCANSLTGIGSIDEALDIVVANRQGQASFHDAEFVAILEQSRQTLADAALLAEATKEESRLATKAAQRALKEAEQARYICDAAVLIRSQMMPDNGLDPNQLAKAAARPERQELLEPINPAHMPVLFPEVFLRNNPGFDVLIGNPPWKQLMVDELDFWNRYSSGLHALNEDQRIRKVSQLRGANPDKVLLYEREVEAQAKLRSAILSGPYPGLGTGGRAPDLYPPFAWRNLGLCRCGGNVGIVLPRSILSGSVNREWRKTALATSRISIVTLHNRRRWVFDITEQQSIVLLNLQKLDTPPTSISVSGPFDEAEKFLARPMKFGTLDIDAIVQSSEELNFPDLSSIEDVEVFRQMRRSPRFDQSKVIGDFRVVSEFNATTDKAAFSSGTERAGWAVLGGKGFDLWNPHLENVFAWANPEKVVKALRAKLRNQVRLISSEFFQYCNPEDIDSVSLPCERPRIAFRDMARAKDARTVIACLLPAHVILTNKAPYVLRRSGSEADEAYLLGVMSSVVFDWFAKRYVELGVSLHIARMLPIPAPDSSGYLKSRLIQNSGRLAAPDERFESWSRAVGVAVGSVTSEAERNLLVAENDALVAHLYGLTREQLEHLFKTFHRGWDYVPRMQSVLEFYDEISQANK